jgi:streptomycin 6-kinase
VRLRNPARCARAVDHALACAARRVAAHDDERAVLVHGDVHQWNALQVPGGFKLVDPDGLLAEAEYDLAGVDRPAVRLDRPAAIRPRDARRR